MDFNKLLDPLHFIDLRNTQHTSVFDKNSKYSMLIIRLPLGKNLSEAVSLGYIFIGEESYFYNKEENMFQKSVHMFEEPYKTIDTYLNELLKSSLKQEENIRQMEESLYEDDPHKHFMKNWLKLKKNLLRVERTMTNSSRIILEMIEEYKSVNHFPLSHYEDIHEHSERVLKSSISQLSKLDYLYSFYNTRTNEKMNRLIFMLTIISAIFLPLNLLVGFFGMNTSGLPFTTQENGTLSAILIMLEILVFVSLSLFIIQGINKKKLSPD